MTRTACLLLLLAAAGAAETVLVDGVLPFEHVWIGEARKELVPAPDQGGQALRLIVDKAPADPYQAQTFIMPLAEGIAAGDTIAVSFVARCIKPNGGSLTVTTGLDREPWTAAFYRDLVVGPAWKEYAFTAVSPAAIPAATARFGFHFGQQAQSIEIAKLRVAKRSP